MLDPLVLLPLSVPPSRLVRPADGGLHKLSGASMGTHWSLAIAGAIEAPDVVALVQAELDAVVAEMSQWEPASELSRFNSAEAGSWHHLSSGFFDVLREGLDIAERTQGAFDPTLGAVIDLWGFGAATPEVLPPDDVMLAEARTASGWRRLELDRSAQRAHQPGGLKLDLSGIAKGHGVDRVAGALEQARHVSFLIEVGGEVVARGVKPDGQPWWVDIEAPPGADLPPIRIGLFNAAVATSGDYRRYLDLDGARLGHSFDPRTGTPLACAPASVTVIHPECMIADALATAIAVLGAEAGLALAEQEKVAAIVIDRHQDTWRRTLSSVALAMAEA
jgi:thiamine biosynthesis lipoprotein